MRDHLISPEFEKAYNNLKSQVNNYLIENKIALRAGRTVDDIIMWRKNDIGNYTVMASDKCPEELVEVVTTFIQGNSPQSQS